MLPLNNRLKDRKLFNAVFREGRTFSNEVLILKTRKGSAGCAKFGFSVGTRFSKKSSVRNRVKRWMREGIRAQMPQIKPGYDAILLINAKYPYDKLSLVIIQKKAENLLKRAKII